jgi:hypothetical protein
VAVVAACAAVGCSGSSVSVPSKRSTSADGPTPTMVESTLAPATAPPTAATTAPAAFVGTVSPVTAADLPHTYRPGCPIGPEALRMVHLNYWGFDGEPHVGAIVVDAGVTDDVLTVFSALFDARFPIRQLLPVDAFGGSDPDSMAADNTSGFNCRFAVAPGPPQWSAHAFGQAIDVNPVENPYVYEGAPQPEAGAAYVDRSVARPGMAVAGGVLVAAFESVGWEWGGRWAGSPDYQHFSKTGT